MRILQVISYGYLAGGAEKSVLLLKEELGRRGHQVMVVSSDHNKNGSEQRFSDKEFSEIDSPGTSLATKVIKHLWYTPSYRAIKDAVVDFKPDIVHFHVMGQLSPSALFALGDVPGVLTVHGPEEYVAGILEWGLPKHLFKTERVAVSNLTVLGKGYYKYFRYLQRPIYRQGFRRHLAAMIAPSQYMANVLEKEVYGIPVRQVYNGIALPPHQPLQNKHRLLYVGRLEHVKGVDVLLRAMPEIVRRFPKVLLSIVGDGAVRPELESFARRHRLQKNVVFHGWLDSSAVSDQYSQATAVVIPSIWPENLPTVCIEALATGRPVIGARSGGIPELVQDGATGRIVAPDDADGLAAAILDILSRPDLSTISRACAASMQSFEIAAFVRNLERLYQKLLDNTLEEL
jgi:glycosyltransferase involved in cell wall biosynthesis